MSTCCGLMFAGQGAQFPGMGKDLADASPAARNVFVEADRILDRPISSLCFEGPEAELTKSANCQPAIYTMSLACLEAMLEKLDLDIVVSGGLSLGEFAALTTAGALPFADGLKLVSERGRLMDDACRRTEGGMAALLNADPALVESVTEQFDIDVANYNCPGQIVVSGARERVEQAVEELRRRGVKRAVMLQVDGAFHSRLMKPAEVKFAPLLDHFNLVAPTRGTVVQNVTGKPVDTPDEIRLNLERQICGSVHWESCVRTMIGSGIDALIEVGPGQVLTGFMRRIDRKFPVYNVGSADDLEKVAEELS